MRLLVYGDLKEYGIRFARPTINRWAKKGEFPPPIRFTSRHHAWTEEAVLKWLECHINGTPYSATNGNGHDVTEKLVNGAWQALPPDKPRKIARRPLPPEPPAPAPKRTRRPLLKDVPLF